jgi:AraC-like DNA-binding protein
VARPLPFHLPSRGNGLQFSDDDCSSKAPTGSRHEPVLASSPNPTDWIPDQASHRLPSAFAEWSHGRVVCRDATRQARSFRQTATRLFMTASYAPSMPQLDRLPPMPLPSTRIGGSERPGPVYPILHLRPPYTPSATAVMVREIDTSKIVPGSVLALHVSARNVDWRSCSETVIGLRRRLPAVPVVLSLGPDIADGLFWAAQAARSSIRAVVAGDAPLGESLRRPLTATDTLGPDVVEWLSLFGLRLSPTLNHLIGRIFTDAPRFSEVGPLLHTIGAAESSTRFRFRKKGLPAPSRWLQAARALHAALRIQLEPGKSILAHACALGYADHSALCHQMKRVFGTTPAAVRETLGWEWLLERWVRAEVLDSRRRPQ